MCVPSLSDRELRERLRRRAHPVRLRTSATNRTFGQLTQWGLRANLTALRKPETLEQLAKDGLPPVWRQSIVTLISVIDDLHRQITPIERELRPIAHSNPQFKLMSIPGIAELLGLTLVAEIGVSRFQTACKLVGYPGLTPTIKQSGQSSRTSRISKAGPNTLRWRPTSPRHRLYTDTKRRHGKANPAKAAVARKVLIACWQSSPSTSRSSRAHPAPRILSRQAPPFIWPPEGPQTI